MCWNWQVSLITWLIGLFTAIYLFRRRNKYDLTFGLLILTYSSMQLWETFMWLDQKCGTLNKTGTVLAYYFLWAHTLAVGLGLYWENKKIVIPLIIGIIFMVCAFLYSFSINWKCSKPSNNGCKHLKWGFPHSFYLIPFIACIIICIIYISPIYKAIIVSLLFVFSFILSWIYAGDSVGSFWCYVCAAFSPIFILINK